jgi:hypothetical protein
MYLNTVYELHYAAGGYKMAVLESPAKEKMFYESRCAERLNCDLEAEISLTWGDKWICKIIDVCNYGFGVVTSLALQRGDFVIIYDPLTRAKVVWCNNNRAGLRILN